MAAVPDEDAIGRATARVRVGAGFNLQTEHALALILLGALAYMAVFRKVFKDIL